VDGGASLHAALNETIIVSYATGGTVQGNMPSANPAMSADGRYIAFASQVSAVTLAGAAADTNGATDIFRRDVLTNTTILISRIPASNTSGDGGSFNPTISANGNCVGFTSNASNLTSAVVGGFNGYVRDVNAGTTRIVNRQSGAADSGAVVTGNGAFEVFVNSSCSHVVFNCSSCNGLTPGEATGTNQIFLRILATSVTERVSRVDGAADVAGNAASGQPSISADGNLVAFQSQATNLNPAETSAAGQIWVRNRAAGTTNVVSRATGAGGQVADDFGAGHPMISADGSSVVFDSRSQLLVPNTLTASLSVTFTVNPPAASSTPTFTSPATATCTVMLQCFHYANAISTDGVDSVTCTAGCPGPFLTPSVSDFGTYGAVVENRATIGATNLTVIADDGAGGGANQQVSQNITMTSVAAPADGIPVFTSPTSVTLTQNTAGGFAENVSRSDVQMTCGPNSLTQVPATSGNCSGALPPGMTQALSGTCNCNGQTTGTPTTQGTFNVVFKAFAVFENVFVRNLNTDTTTQANLRSGTTTQGTNLAANPSISANGRYVAFISRGFDDLVPGAGSDTRVDVYLRDLMTGTTEIASLVNGSTAEASPSTAMSLTFDSSIDGPFQKVPQLISDDGRFVAFSSDATNLVTPDTNAMGDVFRRQRLADPPGTLTVHKDFSDSNTSNVSISVTCTDGASPEVSPLNARDNPDTPAVFTINNAGPTSACTATETTPAGYTADQSGCANVPVGSGQSVSCTITNTLIPTVATATSTPTGGASPGDGGDLGEPGLTFPTEAATVTPTRTLTATPTSTPTPAGVQQPQPSSGIASGITPPSTGDGGLKRDSVR
jgi:hypothetical protein